MLIRTEPQSGKVAELDNEPAFHGAMEQLDAIGGDNRVAVIIQVRGATGGWWDAVEYWSGRYSPDIPMPTTADLVAVGKKFGAHRVRAATRTINGV